MKYGIEETTFQAILNVFKETPEVEDVTLFGSRAMGTHRQGSDIDLSVKGSQITHAKFLELLITLDELELLHQVDLVRYETINNKELLNHIQRVGVSVYSKPATTKPSRPIADSR